jgi:hypothetical protein
MSAETNNIGFGIIMGMTIMSCVIAPCMMYKESKAENEWHDEAAMRGHAEYFLDHNNERQWRWKECGTK